MIIRLPPLPAIANLAIITLDQSKPISGHIATYTAMSIGIIAIAVITTYHGTTVTIVTPSSSLDSSSDSNSRPSDAFMG